MIKGRHLAMSRAGSLCGMRFWASAPTASINEIKAAFRERARQYYPDRVEGLGPEFREIAEKKMKQLNEAYDFAVRSR